MNRFARRGPSARSLRLMALLLALSTALPACSRRDDPNLLVEDRPVVGRDETGRLVLDWSSAPAGSRHRIFTSTDPGAFDHVREVGVIAPDEGVRRVVLPEPPPRTRAYYELVDERRGRRRVVAERLLPLDGAHNFRDLGGYETRDGRAVRWGMLYRSDHLGDLTEDDVAYVQNLGIRLVCDFRGRKEREAAPDRLPASQPPEVALFEIADERFDPDDLKRRLLAGDLEDLDLGQLLIEGNRRFATDYRDRYARLFERIANEANLPALIHCTAGKDRAGFGAALLLLALGVPIETVQSDFMLTNLFTAEAVERMLIGLRVFSLFRTDPEAVRPLMTVRPSYLQAALDAIEERYGSIDVYLREGLGVSDAKRASLQARLLE